MLKKQLSFKNFKKLFQYPWIYLTLTLLVLGALFVPQVATDTSAHSGNRGFSYHFREIVFSTGRSIFSNKVSITASTPTDNSSQTTPVPQATSQNTITPKPPVQNVVPTTPTSKTNSEILLDMINKIRTDNGLPALKADATLNSIALHRSTDMATKNYFDHTSPSGETAFTLLKSNGINYHTAAENIAWNDYPDSQTLQVTVDGWMNSSGHKANILTAGFQYSGIGIAKASNGKIYYTQIFVGY